MGTPRFQVSVVIVLASFLLGVFVSAPISVAQEMTPTPLPRPTIPNFPDDPYYEMVPTAIPDIDLPVLPGLPSPPPIPQVTPSPWVTPQLPEINLPDTPPPVTPSPWATPQLPEINLPETPIPTLSPINASIGLSYSTPAPINISADMTATNTISGISGLLLSTRDTISDIVSYTNGLSTTIYQITIATDTLNIDHAPDWYAPALPRPMADVGWRFEQMGTDVTRRYSIAAWGIWMIEVLTLPIKFIKGLSFIAELFGPFGLFLAWLLIMFPVVLLFKALNWLKNLIIQIFNFLFDLIRIIIGKLVPFW